MKESIILFDDKKYNLVDRIAMGFPFGPALANVFLRHDEIIWLGRSKFTPKNYKKLVDDAFVLFENLSSYYSLLRI